MKPYLIVFTASFASREQVTNYLNTLPEVRYWYACLPLAVFCVSSLSAHDLAKKMERHFGHSKGRRFLVTEVTPNKQGRLPAKAWELMNDPDDVQPG